MGILDNCRSLNHLNNFFVELIYRPSIQDNITSWRIFDDDQQIIDFLHSEYTFRGLIIDNEQKEALLQDSASEDKPKYSNPMTKNIVRMEKLFNLQDKFKKSTNTKTKNSSLKYEAINLGIEKNPKNINIGI